MPTSPEETQNREGLAAISERLREAAKKIDAVSLAMETFGYESLEVTHYKTLVTSMNGIERYVHAVWDAQNERRENEGHFKG